MIEVVIEEDLINNEEKEEKRLICENYNEEANMRVCVTGHTFVK